MTKPKLKLSTIPKPDQPKWDARYRRFKARKLQGKDRVTIPELELIRAEFMAKWKLEIR